MGDPAGVGPETIAGAWPDPRLHAWCRPLVVGHPDVLRRALQLLGLSVDVVSVESPETAESSPGKMPCLQAVDDDAADVPPAQVDPRAGKAAHDALVAATQLALAGRVAAITTAPLNKAALNLAGFHYPGHTELLAELCGVADFAMMLYLGPDETIRSPAGLAVVHVTLHTGLRDVFAELTPEAILAKALLVDDVMRRLKGEAPRIGVCALNPHAGEDGLFGDEERRLIEPVVRRGRAAGLDLSGPWPADTLMVAARDGRYDAVVAMYHDQGHIALKLLGMHRAVNVTLGLPIIRTSVAHGTAFDLAWQGRAEITSLFEAVRVAGQLAGASTLSAKPK